MSGLVMPQDLCAPWVAQVLPGWRGGWPCPGEKELTSGPPEHRIVGLLECSCPCHAGGPAHELPRLSDRTAVHPTDVLGARCSTMADDENPACPIGSAQCVLDAGHGETRHIFESHQAVQRG